MLNVVFANVIKQQWRPFSMKWKK